jgi:hypothetical protein
MNSEHNATNHEDIGVGTQVYLVQPAFALPRAIPRLTRGVVMATMKRTGEEVYAVKWDGGYRLAWYGRGMFEVQK